MRYTFLYSAVLERYLSRLGLHSRFGVNILGIRVSYMLQCSAVLKGYLSRLGLQSRFGDKSLGIRVIYIYIYFEVLYILCLCTVRYFEGISPV